MMFAIMFPSNLFEFTSVLLVIVALTATAVWTFAGLMTLAWRRVSAAARHRTWALSMLAVLIAPLLIPFVPSPKWAPWQTPGDSVAKLAPPQNLYENSFDLKSDIHDVDEQPQPTKMPIESVASYRSPIQPTPAVSSLPAASAAASLEREALIQPEISTDWHAIKAALILVWTVGMLVGVILFLRSTRRVRRLLRGALLIEEGNDYNQFIALRKSLGVREHVKLGVSSEEVVPFVTGWTAPVVVLPAGFGNWTSERLNVVLAHELIHIRRADLFWQTIARLCLIVAWFHPLAWLAAWRLRVEREVACDDAVLSTGETPSAYASHLVEIASELQKTRPSFVPTVAMASRSQVEDRVRSILDPTVARKPAGRLRTSLSGMVLLAAMAGVAILSPSWAQPSANSNPVTGAATIANNDESESNLESSPLSEDPDTRKTQVKGIVDARSARARKVLGSVVELTTDSDTSLQEIIRDLVRQHRVTIRLDEASFYSQGIAVHQIPPQKLSGLTLQTALNKLMNRLLAPRGVAPVVKVEHGAIVLGAELPWKDQSQVRAAVAVAYQSNDENGNPVPDTLLECKGNNGIYYTLSDSKGFCQMVGEGVTQWYCFASDPTGSKISHRYHGLHPKKPTEPFLHTMGDAAPLVVQVNDDDGKPVTDATVVVHADRYLHQQTSADGKAHFKLPTGFHYLTSVHALKSGHGMSYIGHSPQWAKEVPPELTLKLSNARSVNLKAVDQHGEPLPGVAIAPSSFAKIKDGEVATKNTMRWWNPVGHNRPLTNDEGEVRFDWLPPNQQITFKVNNSDLDHNQLVLSDLTQTEVQFAMTRAVDVSARVVDVDGKPVAGATITGRDYPRGGALATNQNGEFFFQAKPGADFYLDVSTPKQHKGRTDWITADSSQPIVLDDIVVKPPTRIHGQVTWLDNSLPASGIQVELYIAAPPGRGPEKTEGGSTYRRGYGISTYADDNGDYEFFVGRGKYEVKILGHPENVRKLIITGSGRHLVNIVTPRSVPFQGTVVTGDSEHPVAAAKIKLKPLNSDAWHWELTTDDEGHFKSHRDAVPGVVYVQTEDEKLIGGIDILEDAADLQITVAPPMTVQARLRNSQRQPLVNQNVNYGVVATANVKGRDIDFTMTKPYFGVTEKTGLITLENMAVGAPYIIEVEGMKGKYVPLEWHRTARIVDIVIGGDTAKSMATAEPPQPGESPPIAAGSSKRPTLQQTIDKLREAGNTDDADYLQGRMAYAEKNMKSRNHSFVFGRLVLKGKENPQWCNAQMHIQKSGWFLGSVGDTQAPVDFRMWAYLPSQAIHGGLKGTIANVGEVVAEPYLFDQLATVRGKVLFEGDVQPDDVSIEVKLESGRTNSATGGTNGYLPWPEKEKVILNDKFEFEKTGLSPLPHYFLIRAARHLPFRREFTMEPGGTTDVGVLRVAASPRFDVEWKIADSPDFTQSERNAVSVHAGDKFETNPGDYDWVEAGQLSIHEENRRYSFRCGLHGLLVTDLGSGKLDDYPTPSHPGKIKPHRRGDSFKNDHVYLISHTFNKPDGKTWKHWTLLRVSLTPAQTTPGISVP